MTDNPATIWTTGGLRVAPVLERHEWHDDPDGRAERRVECREILPGDDTPFSHWTLYEAVPGDSGRLESWSISDHDTHAEALAAMAELEAG